MQVGPHWSRTRVLMIFLLVCGIAGVVSVYTRLSMTDDEGFHVYCGMEWIYQGTYTRQPLHPPLARGADALLVSIVNTLFHGKAWDSMPPRDAYIGKMILTRLGALPFYIISCMLVFIWSRRLFGEKAALFSLLFYISLSSVTAHAALATTDMAYTAVFLWALMRGIDWLKTPDKDHSMMLGISLGVMICTKFSGLAQWPVAMLLVVMALSIDRYRRSMAIIPFTSRHIINGLRFCLPMLALIILLVYHFSLEPFFQGLKDAAGLSRHGYSVWFYGPLNNSSVWYFFPVVFFFKTPLSFLAAAILGNGRVIRELGKEHGVDRLYPLLAALAVLLVSMTSHINLGVRHVLPLYPLLAIPAGYGMAWLAQGKLWQQCTASFLAACQLSAFICAYPEHIAYFNPLVGDHPEHITLDSDYDWGQDMILLDEALQERGIHSIYLCVRKDAVWNANVILHADIRHCPEEPVAGWVAVGRAYMQMHDKIAWLKAYEAVHMGNSTIDLYYIPPKDP